MKKLLRRLGMDRAIAYVIIGQGWLVLAGPVNVFFLATSLTPVEQGFYYTFTGLLGMQSFLELGLYLVLLQFATRERARLEWTAKGTLEGEAMAKTRLASLLRRALRWYGLMALLAAVILLPVGLTFFGRHQPVGENVAWQIPWMGVVVVAACNLFLTPVFAILEGCGLVRQVAFLRTIQNVATSLVNWTLLSQGWKLLAVPAFHSVVLLLSVGWLLNYQKSFLVDMAKIDVQGASLNWRREVWPFQWRIALSGISGYFIFAFFNPVIFAFHGAVAAGQMGMSYAVMSAMAAGAGSWVGTKVPAMGNLVARREWEALDRLFFPAMRQSVSIVAIAGVAFWCVSLYLHATHHSWSSRVLGPWPLGFLVAATILNATVGCKALYLRAHGQEPFLFLSICTGCLTGLSTYLTGKYMDVTAMMAGFFLVTLFVAYGGGTWVFGQKRRVWHHSSSTDTPVQAPILEAP